MQQNKKITDLKMVLRLFDKGVPFIAFDTETTSLSPNTGRIIEIGAVKFNKDGPISFFSQLINPQTIIPPFITELTGITTKMTILQPSMYKVLPSFLDFIEDTTLIAHNAQFDMNFLNAECIKCNMNPTKNKFIDTLIISNRCFPELEKHKLDFLADNLNLDKGNSHRALDDAKTCYELFLKCLDKYRLTKIK